MKRLGCWTCNDHFLLLLMFHRVTFSLVDIIQSQWQFGYYSIPPNKAPPQLAAPWSYHLLWMLWCETNLVGLFLPYFSNNWHTMSLSCCTPIIIIVRSLGAMIFWDCFIYVPRSYTKSSLPASPDYYSFTAAGWRSVCPHRTPWPVWMMIELGRKAKLLWLPCEINKWAPLDTPTKEEPGSRHT